jgi:hypothetical protein
VKVTHVNSIHASENYNVKTKKKLAEMENPGETGL